jgi:RNA polymerase sigma-70 factor (ECF subfamily)
LAVTTPGPDVVTRLLQDWAGGDRAARDRLMAVVYDELRRIARRYMRNEPAGHTLQPTALVNEAYLRLIDQQTPWQNRAHFFAIAAQLMRRILVDRARARGSAKRGGMHERTTLSDVADLGDERGVDLIALDQALTALAELDPRQASVVELRFFGGLTIQETAEALGVSHTIIEREWSLARAWLRRELERAHSRA